MLWCNPRTEWLWTVWSDCSCESSRSDGKEVCQQMWFTVATQAVICFLQFSLLWENEKDQIGLCLRGETMGLIRSLLYPTDFSLRDDVIAMHWWCWPCGFARELLFKMRFVDRLWHWNTVFWWVAMSSVTSIGTCLPLRGTEKLLGKMKLQGRVGVPPQLLGIKSLSYYMKA